MKNIYDAADTRIRQLREMNRYTREQFAEISDTGQKGFSADTLYRIAKGLSVTCEYILSGDYPEDYDKEVQDALKLYNGAQMKNLSALLKEIYELSTKFDVLLPYSRCRYSR